MFEQFMKSHDITCIIVPSIIYVAPPSNQRYFGALKNCDVPKFRSHQPEMTKEREKQLFGYYGLGILETQETSRCLNHGTWNAPTTHCGNPPKNGPLKWENHL